MNFLDETPPPASMGRPPLPRCRAGDALLIVDVQNDFLPGGALAVPGGEEVVPILNRYLSHFAAARLPVFAARDWHPEDHCSFRDQGGPWPTHCVIDTTGAEFASNLELPPTVSLVSKGSLRDREDYSGFSGTDLEERLRTAGVRRLYIGGLTTDYCVLHTVRDARRRGFDVFLLRDAIRAVDREPGDGKRAVVEMVAAGAIAVEMGVLERWMQEEHALLTDWYQLTMLRGYFASAMEETAVFEFFVRKLPPGRNFLIAAGLEQTLDFLEEFCFSPDELAWLKGSAGFDHEVMRRLGDLRFTGDVHAMPEGTVFFPDEPILRVTAPLPQAQVIESRLVNLLHLQTVIASKAVRSVLAAPGKPLVDFGLRRAHGAEAGLLAARACYLAGFSGSSNVLAWRHLGIPCTGTMAHSFVEAGPSEEEAFLRFARANPQNVVLLIDTYDTEAGARKVVEIAPVLRGEGIVIKGVRLDSGDLVEHARRVRKILDRGGLPEVTIFASGNIDEHVLQQATAAAAPIDGFGVGTRVLTSADAPYLDCAYKLQSYAGLPRCKHSEGKATWPDVKQVYRRYDREGLFERDVIALDSELPLGEPLLECVMQGGRRTASPAPLSILRERVRMQLVRLPERLRSLEGGARYRVDKSAALRKVAAELGLTEEQGAPGSLNALGMRNPLTRRLHRIYADKEATIDGVDEPVEEEIETEEEAARGSGAESAR